MKFRIPMILTALFLTAGLCHMFERPFDRALIDNIKHQPFDHASATASLAFMTAEEHPFGSPRQRAIADHILQKLATQGFDDGYLQQLVVDTPNPKALAAEGAPVNPSIQVTGQNVVVRTSPFFKRKPPCVVILGSHYDTKMVEGISYLGANDSGSSSVALMALLPMVRDIIPKAHLQCEIMAVWFDGEESTLTQWDSGEREHPAHIVDHPYGSRFLATSLVPCPTHAKTLCLPESLGSSRVVALIQLDMIGSRQITLTEDLNSTPQLTALLREANKALFSTSILGENASPVNDDHIPFKERGIPVLDIIDFNNLQYWHNNGDTADNVALDSIEKAVRLSLLVSLAVAIHPELAGDTSIAP